MKLDVYNLNNEKVGEVDVSDSVFGTEVKPYLFHEVVRMQEARRRRGTHKQKTRSEVRGGGRKPYRQKGTGRARQGSIRSIQWVGGGRAFPARPRDYSFKLSKKKKRAALCSALSMLAGEGRIKVLDAFELDEIKTAKANAALQTIEIDRALIVDGTPHEGAQHFDNNETLRLSVRNLPRVKYQRPDGVNVRDLLNYGTLVVTQGALKGLQERLER